MNRTPRQGTQIGPILSVFIHDFDLADEGIREERNERL